MERVIKGKVGFYSKENAEKGKLATHIILTTEEYDSLRKEIRTLETKVTLTEKEGNKKVLEAERIGSSKLYDLQSTMEKQKNMYIDKINELVTEQDRLNSLNQNLLRISKERANAKRGLTPKKLHDGYVISSSKQYTYVFRYVVKGKKLTKEMPCWKNIIQTPYDCSININIIQDNIINDLVDNIGSKLGLSNLTNLNGSTLEEFKEIYESKENSLIKLSYQANTKSKLWEIECLTRYAINMI